MQLGTVLAIVIAEPMKNLLSNHSDQAADPLARFDGDEPTLLVTVSRDGLMASPRFSYRLERAHDEDDLIRRCAMAGDDRSKAVTQILERLEPATFLICNLLIEDRLEAAACSEDACVEAVIQLFKGTPANASDFRVNFFRILRRHCQERAAMSSPASNPAHSEFRALIADMPERQRWLSVLRFVANLSRAEIAMVLGISSSDVKSDLWIALRRIMGADFANGV